MIKGILEDAAIYFCFFSFEVKHAHISTNCYTYNERPLTFLLDFVIKNT